MIRRDFIRYAVFGTIAAPWFGGCVDGLMTAPIGCGPGAAVRISGRVVSRGKGIGRVAITVS